MWYVLDGETLEEVDIVKTKREAVLRYSKDNKSERISKGIYLVTD